MGDFIFLGFVVFYIIMFMVVFMIESVKDDKEFNKYIDKLKNDW